MDKEAALAADPSVAAAEDSFKFGRNWQRYVEHYMTRERVEGATDSVRELIPRNIEGEAFFDIGSGSGLFSLVAHRLGASRVVSVDVDAESVESTKALRAAEGDPDNWTVLRASILDDKLPDGLGPASIVYSWGVLHHTGDMWRAISNAADLVAPGGLFVIAIYNRCTGVLVGSERWQSIKRFHNRAPRPIQMLMELGYQAYALPRHAAARLKRGKNPFKVLSDYQPRGMDLRTDMVDWLGGYPYEFATAEELVGFCERECGLKAVKVLGKPSDSLELNEIVLEKPLTG